MLKPNQKYLDIIVAFFFIKLLQSEIILIKIAPMFVSQNFSNTNQNYFN